MITQSHKIGFYSSLVFEHQPLFVETPLTLVSVSYDGLGYTVSVPGNYKGAVGVYLALDEITWNLLDEDKELEKYQVRVDGKIKACLYEVRTTVRLFVTLSPTEARCANLQARQILRQLF